MLFPLVHPPIFWFALGVILLAAELLTPAFMIFFFGVGAILTAVACLLFDLSVSQQLLLFTVSSVILLVTLRRLLKPIFAGNASNKPNADEYNGRIAVVLEAIEPGKAGKVELFGTAWKAIADSSLPVGTSVRILSRESTVLKVTAL